MNITELIKALEDFKKENWDILVFTPDTMYQWDAEITFLELAEEEKHFPKRLRLLF